MVTVAVIMILAGINILGVRWGGLLQLFITLIKVGSLVGIALLPFLASYITRSVTPVPEPRPENLLPLWPDWQHLDFGKVGTALVGVLWAYHGWMNIAPVAEASLCGFGIEGYALAIDGLAALIGARRKG